MPITFNCPCGKKLQVADQHAGRLVKCPACGATRTAGQPATQAATQPTTQPTAPAAPQPAAQPAPPAAPRRATAEPEHELEDIEVVEEVDEPAPGPKAAKSAPRMKAVAVEEPEEPKAPAPAKPKKKKKKKKAAAESEGDDDWYEKARESQDRMVRIARGGAYVLLGVVILAGFGYICLRHWQNVREGIWWIQLAVYALPIVGLAALGKGAIGLAFGQFLGDDE